MAAEVEQRLEVELGRVLRGRRHLEEGRDIERCALEPGGGRGHGAGQPRLGAGTRL